MIEVERILKGGGRTRSGRCGWKKTKPESKRFAKVREGIEQSSTTSNDFLFESLSFLPLSFFLPFTCQAEQS